ncbi:MAG: tripartite tricarboxylate transporter TctB family protein [Lachnospiraceae bacterium]|nr:tripartite tricarboxylate transporter TctB family protein [Lachnospiraceae bacterium]
MDKKYKDVIVGSVLAALSVIYLMLSFQIKLTNIDRIVGSRMFPQICGTIILVLSICLIIGGLQKAKKTESEKGREKRNYTRTVLVLGSYALYIFLMDKIGFTISSVIYLFSQMVVMGKWPASKKSMILYLVISASVSAAIYVTFNNVFMLILPKAGWF